jgi:hypothetical protein
VEQQHRKLHAAVGAPQRLARVSAAAASEPHEDRLASPHQLLVDGLQINHQALVHAPEQDHHQRRQKVQRDALRGAGFHPGRAGNRLGAGLEQDRMIRFGQHRRAAVVGDADGQGAVRLGLAQTSERERRRAAGCDRDEHVALADAMTPNEQTRLLGLVLGAFDRLQQRVLAAGHEQQEPVARPAEGRHQLGAVLHRKASRRSGASIDQPPAGPQPALGRKRGALDGRPGGADRRHRRKLAFDHRVQDV